MTLKTRLHGKAHKFGDDVTADDIIAGKHRPKVENVLDLKSYVFHDIRPDFIQRVTPGDILVAGHNFGMGSSREHATSLLKACGIEVVLAKSFARIFFRNAINIGLPVIECDTDPIAEGDVLAVDLERGAIRLPGTGAEIAFASVPESLRKILEAGGLVPYLKGMERR
jgi:3-isopropylmalate/(R)-2-methylmalate dehydratase small subunit